MLSSKDLFYSVKSAYTTWLYAQMSQFSVVDISAFDIPNLPALQRKQCEQAGLQSKL